MANLVKVKSGKAFVSLRALVKGSGDTPAPSPSIPSEEFEELKSKVTENTSKIAQVENSTNVAIANVDDKIDAAEYRISNNETDVAELTAVVSQNKETIENEIADLEESIDSKINTKIAGAFRFRGSKESLDSLNAIEDTDRHEGDVWQVGEKEYAYNGTEFVELGFSIDLSAYATVANVTAQIASKASVEQVAEVAADVEKKANKSDLTELENSVSSINATLEDKANQVEVDTALANKVDKESGKVLSSNDFTTAEKEKLAGLSNFDPSELESAISNKANIDHNHDNSYAPKDATEERFVSVEREVRILNDSDLASKEYVDGKVSSKANAEDINELSQRISAVETYGTRLDTNESRTSEVSDKVDEIDARLTEVEANKASVSYVNESNANLVATIQSMASTINTLQDEIRTLSNTIIALRAYVDSLHNGDMSESDRQLVNAAVNGTPYVVPESDNAEDVTIDVPLFNTVNVTSENVNITSDITAVNESAAGIQIKASDKVTVGE